MLALVTIDGIKIEEALVVTTKGPRSKVIDLTCFRRKMHERYNWARVRAHMVLSRFHGNREIGVTPDAANPRHLLTAPGRGYLLEP